MFFFYFSSLLSNKRLSASLCSASLPLFSSNFHHLAINKKLQRIERFEKIERENQFDIVDVKIKNFNCMQFSTTVNVGELSLFIGAHKYSESWSFIPTSATATAAKKKFSVDVCVLPHHYFLQCVLHNT